MAEIRPLPLLNQPIHLGADPAGGPAVAGDDEQRGLGMLEPGLAGAVEMLKPLEPQRRPPFRVVAIERAGNLDAADRTSVRWGARVADSVDIGGRRNIKKKK